MKRLSLLGFVGLLSSVFAGCPIYDDSYEDESSSTTETPPNTNTCSVTSDCGNNETCGKDNQCHPGDCSFSGCSDGFTCVVDPAAQTASCKPSSEVGSVVYCGNPKDCGDSQSCAPNGTCRTGSCSETGCIYGYTCQASTGKCTRTNPAGCAVDTDCASAGAGFTCVSGLCTQPSDLCFDQTQCASGDKCVAGKCTPSCSTSPSACSVDSGYACDASLGVCRKPIKSCTITNDCGGAKSVCVAGACVPRSAEAVCPKGNVWVDNGCIPNQSASFTCGVDGQQDACLQGSICLHHSCYISCETDATVCTTQPTLNQCKPVTTTSGEHKVCGSKENLGGECDPTTSLACSGSNICVDGFCK
jgi:hypothetical protein